MFNIACVTRAVHTYHNLNSKVGLVLCNVVQT